MNIKQALKAKNKLVGEIAINYSIISNYNSIETGVERPYDVNEAYTQWRKSTDELVTLKVAIHKANVPVFDKIFQMAELKSVAKSLKSLNCNSGKETSNHYSRNEKDIIREASIPIRERDNRLKEVESKIDQLQDELDLFNSTTTI